MNKNVPKVLALMYASVFTVCAIASGADKADGFQGIISNLPNATPWITVWLAIIVAWKNTRLGGVLFLILAGASVFFFHTYQELVTFIFISTPLIAIGALLLILKK